MVFFIMFLIGGLVLSFKCNNLLLMLLSLEFMILSLFMMIFYMMSFFMNELYFSMIFIIMSVCEGVIGLSLLVMMVRCYGNDFFCSFNIMW
uniref:NADH-ubiquinone oxidoreductase chain 4L n=1 Tax=Ptiliidae sp. BMNH 1274724 TaxID=1796537 RepID=A0A126TGB5_9COLE|nr:NADH dehydrogenase subunit 4L [Ptiliidae sp. BMNH 1274724]